MWNIFSRLWKPSTRARMTFGKLIQTFYSTSPATCLREPHPKSKTEGCSARQKHRKNSSALLGIECHRSPWIASCVRRSSIGSTRQDPCAPTWSPLPDALSSCYQTASYLMKNRASAARYCTGCVVANAQSLNPSASKTSTTTWSITKVLRARFGGNTRADQWPSGSYASTPPLISRQ